MSRRLWFDRAKFTETAKELCAPARGWYQIYPFRVEQEPDLEELKWCLKESETCVLLLLDIGGYRDRDLDDPALAHIRQLLAFFDGHKKDIILRVAYDREGRGMEHEPSLFSQVLTHIEQLGPALRDYARQILLFEGMLVGNWGEMHGSRFLTKKYMAQLNEALSQCAPGILRSVRRPAQWRMLHQEPPGPGTAVGLFNDAIFGSATDLGTFAPENSPSENWEEPWPAEKELAFEQQLSAFVPQCGEAVLGGAYQNETLCSTVERLRQMGMTCLNGVYDENILRLWKGWTWDGPDIWQGMNGYDYIGRHLGYRFCVRSAAAKAEKNFCEITLAVENVGFSGFYQEAEVLLLLTDTDGRETEFLTDWDVRDWKSGQTVTLTWRMPRRAGTLRLSARRKWDREPICFANIGSEQGSILIGEWKT